MSCRSEKPKTEFWRIVRTYPEHQVQLDVGMGRSAYICPSQNCLDIARKKNKLGRNIKANIPETIYQTLAQRLNDL